MYKQVMTSATNFYKTRLNFSENLFTELVNQTDFEPLGKGRMGTHLVKPGEAGIPIVRTTTAFTTAAQGFTKLHQEIVTQIDEDIQQAGFPKANFNHALIEKYTAEYTKMKYHSDQALDLATNSYIGLFSCYQHPEKLGSQNTRILRIKDKITQEEADIPLTQHSLVLFSTETNSRFFHKIILPQKPQQNESFFDNEWLGITFRTSKTYLQFKENRPYFENGTPLLMADPLQQKQFYKLRGQENKQLDFTYPELEYTLSKADTLFPKK